MKRSFLILLTLICIFSCSCADASQNGNNFDKVTGIEPELVSYLFGDWVSSYGDTEKIDENTINGSPYTLKAIREDSSYNITAIVEVNGSEVTYKIYRYYVGYAEYSYMEAVVETKDVVFKFSK